MTSHQINLIRAAAPYVKEELRPLIMTFLSAYEINMYSQRIQGVPNLNNALSPPLITDYDGLLESIKRAASPEEAKSIENAQNMLQMITLMNSMNQEE